MRIRLVGGVADGKVHSCEGEPQTTILRHGYVPTESVYGDCTKCEPVVAAYLTTSHYVLHTLHDGGSEKRLYYVYGEYQLTRGRVLELLLQNYTILDSEAKP